jgi:hypothetical protein
MHRPSIPTKRSGDSTHERLPWSDRRSFARRVVVPGSGDKGAAERQPSAGWGGHRTHQRSESSTKAACRDGDDHVAAASPDCSTWNQRRSKWPPRPNSTRASASRRAWCSPGASQLAVAPHRPRERRLRVWGTSGLRNSTAAGSRYPSNGPGNGTRRRSWHGDKRLLTEVVAGRAMALARAEPLELTGVERPSPKKDWSLSAPSGASPGAAVGSPFARNAPGPERRPQQPPGADRAAAPRRLWVAAVVPMHREAVSPGLWSLDLAVHARATCAGLAGGPDSRGYGDRGMFHVERPIGPVVLAHPRPASVGIATDTPGHGGRHQDSASRGACRAARVSLRFPSSP